jgi:hypothetical protein
MSLHRDHGDSVQNHCSSNFSEGVHAKLQLPVAVQAHGADLVQGMRMLA